MADERIGIEISVENEIFRSLAKLQEQFTELGGKVEGLEQQAGESFSGIKDSIELISLTSLTQGLGDFRDTLSAVNEPGLAFEQRLAELSAITGVAGEELDNLGQMARDNARVFGGDAADSVETYKLLLSQLSPELGKYPDILAGMGDATSTLAKTMGGDVRAAVETVTTAMNQYGVDMSDPVAAQAEFNRMMNAMAAGAKEGSAELPALKEAIENVGGDAKSSGLGFEQMVSALEALDKAGKKSSEGGVALRNVLASLNQGRFLPDDVRGELSAVGVDVSQLADKTVSFTDKMRMLHPVLDDSALVAKLFGKENKLAAEALIRSADSQDGMTQAITGTSTAYDQAAIIMDTNAEKLSRLDAVFNDIKITIGQATGALLPYAEGLFGVAKGISTILPIIKLLTASQWRLNVAMIANPIGLIIVGIGALIALAAAIIIKYDEWGAAMTFLLGPLGMVINVIQSFRRNWTEVTQAFQYGGIELAIKKIGAVMVDALLMPVQQLLDMLGQIPGIGKGFKIQAGWVEEWRRKLGVNMGGDGPTPGVDDNMDSMFVPDYVDTDAVLPFADKEGEQEKRKTAAKGGKAPSGGGKSPGVGFANAEKKEINVRIEKLVGEFLLNSGSTRESKAEIRRMIAEALVGAVRDFETTI